MIPLAGFAKEHALNGAAGMQSFFDEASALHSDEAALRRQAAAERHTELLEPAVVAAREQCWPVRGSRIAEGFAKHSHSLEVSKLEDEGANARTSAPERKVAAKLPRTKWPPRCVSQTDESDSVRRWADAFVAEVDFGLAAMMGNVDVHGE